MADARLTRNQSLVLEALCAADGPMSAYNILDQLRPDGIKAPLQVYRALDKLMASGLAHRLESLNAFVACAHPQCHRAGLTAFAICEKCGQVDEFSDEEVRARLMSRSSEMGFKPYRTVVEIRGLCAQCADAKVSA